MNTRYVAAIAVGAAALTLTACSSSSTATDSAADTSTSTSAAQTSPAAVARAATYTLHESGKDAFSAIVTTADTYALNMAWTQIRDQLKSQQPDGGYFVTFDCATPAPGTTGRLANAKVAVGRLGAAQTGLDIGKAEMKILEGIRCGDDPGYQSTVDRKAALTAESVNDLCHEFIEEKYTVEQLPVTITPSRASAGADGEWVATGTAKGSSKYGTDSALMNYTCTVSNNTGTLMREVVLR